MAMAPQTSLGLNPNADTSTPQSLQAPTQLNPYKMGNQTQQLQAGGMPTAQAVTKSAQNPANKYAKGGPVPPTAGDLEDQLSKFKPDASSLKAVTTAVEHTKAIPKDQRSDLEKEANPEPFHDPVSKADQETLDMFDNALKPVQHKVQGGDIHETIKKMPLEAIVKLLASHPEIAGGLGGRTPMKDGGAVTNMKSEAREHGAGLLNMNADVPGYANGGKVKQTYSPQIPAGTLPPNQQQSGSITSVGMAKGGNIEEDNITGYGPDGTPIVQNPDGTTQSGDINSLLDRPSNAPTAATGQSPITGVTQNAANSVAGNKMAKGGEENGVPPGSLSKEVADDVPANLSEGEFVFSADVVRYYGLRVLNAMMEHARQALEEMENEGNIRSPGDGKDNVSNDTAGKGQGVLSTFIQDQKPDLDTYDDQGGNGLDKGADDQVSDDEVSGILKECMGGGLARGGNVMHCATGGGIAEEDFAAGGEVGGAVDSSYGNDSGYGANTDVLDDATGGAVGKAENLSTKVSPHPKAGTPLLDYAKGGTVSSTSTSLTPKRMESGIATAKIKLSKPTSTEAIKIPKPSFKGGGLLVKNMTHSSVPTQSVTG